MWAPETSRLKIRVSLFFLCPLIAFDTFGYPKDAVSDVPAGMVLSTLIGYLVIYASLIIAYMGVITYLAGKATRGEPLTSRQYPRGGTTDVPVLQPGE